MIAPSLLSADFAHLAREMAWLNRSQAHWLHLDVMDGVFVPNISFGFPVLKAVAACCTKPLDAHLMIVQPEKFVAEVAALGAEVMTVHIEACTHLHRVLGQIRDAGMKAGVALNPATPVDQLQDVIEMADVVLLMSVNPGFGGQRFIPRTLDKVARLRQLIEERKCHTLIEVDGGVTPHNAPLLYEAGADVLVAGSSVFGAPDPLEACARLAAPARP